MEEMKTALLELTSQICKVDGFRFKYAMIFQNTIDETAEPIAVLTTRALYKNGRGSASRDEDAFSAYKVNGQVNGLVYKFIDGAWVQQTGKVFPYASYSSTNKCNAFYNGVNFVANYKITWSNYPIYRVGVLKGAETTDENALYGQRLKPVAYKESDEPLTLDMLPAGAGVVFGRYKVGTSEIIPLTWIVCDYTERFTKAISEGDIANIYGESNVVLTSEKVIDILPINDTTDFKNSLAWDRNSELMKYLNSDASSNYWYEAFEGDTQDNRGYFPQGGFLRYFTQQEKEILQTVYTRRSASSLIEGKVHLPSLYEIASTTSVNYVTNWLVCEFGIYYITDPLLHPILEHHPVSPQTNFTEWVRTYWKKEISGSQGAQLSGSSSTSKTAGNLGVNVLPCIYLPADQPVKVTPNADGDYEIEFPFIETFEVDYILPTSRKVIVEEDSIVSTCRVPACDFDFSIPAYRNMTASSSEILKAERKVVYNGAINSRHRTHRKRIRNTERLAKTSRSVIGRLETVLQLHRNIAINLFDVDTVINTERNTTAEQSVKTKAHRQVYISKVFDILIKSSRKIVREEYATVNTSRNIKILTSFASDINTNRRITDVNLTDAPVSRAIVQRLSDEWKATRCQIVNYEKNIETTRQIKVAESIDTSILSARKVIQNVDNTIPANRQAIGEVIENTLCDRNIVASSDFEAQTVRNITSISEFESNLQAVRRITADLIVSIDAMRSVSSLSDATMNISRFIIHDHVSIVECHRAVSMEENTSICAVRQITAENDEIILAYRTIQSVVENDTLVPSERSVIVDDLSDVSSCRNVISTGDTVLKTKRIVRAIDRRGTVELLESKTVKNDKGISNIKYETIGYLKGNIHPVKANVESLPIGLSDKTKYLLITNDKKIQSKHYVRIDSVIYGIDMLTKYTLHKEVYLKEL